MCVIICKRRGLKMPSNDIIRKCFDANEDGFGMAFTSPNSSKVTILKGAMTLKEAFKIIKQVKDARNRHVVMHFRIATHGKIRPENCHPFPMSGQIKWLKELSLLTPIAIAHNGVINIKEDGETGYQQGIGREAENSDTQLFIKYYLAGLGAIVLNKQVAKLIEGFAKGKFAILTNQGIRTLGKFEEKDGIMYSNLIWDRAPFVPSSISTPFQKQLFECCDFCGRFGELKPVVPYIYACRYCTTELDLPTTKDFITMPLLEKFLQNKNAIEQQRLGGIYDY